MSAPRISVIITAYDSAAFIGEAIESVLAQTRPADEIVAVDDGSTDDTARVIQSYAARGVRYVYQPNQGPGAARNRGLRETSGEWVAFLDGDDLWLPEKTAHQADYLTRHPEVALVSGHKVWWDVNRNARWIKKYGLPPRADLAREIVIHNFVGNPSMTLIRRAALDEIGYFDTTLRWGQDRELWIRLIAQARIGFLDEPVIIYRWHPGSLSHQREWERLNSFFEISRRAIRNFQPVWWRPILLARAHSFFEFIRAGHSIQRQLPRYQQLSHAAQALLAYPLENTAAKVKMVTRVLIGETMYRRWRGMKSSPPPSSEVA
jgi:glycosyltransferase involved in cell wall biosynthesis